MGRTRIVTKEEPLDTGNATNQFADAIRETNTSNVQITETRESNRQLRRLNDQLEEVTDMEVTDPQDK